MPSDLSELEQHYWNRLVPLLTALGTLTTDNEDVLRALCQELTKKQMAWEQIIARGIVIESPQGMKTNPACNVHDKAQKQVRVLLGEFGLTPSARTRLRSVNPAHASLLDQILAARPQHEYRG
ncbi:MAG TPA: phage terminase small subunit P27 family [Terracidiphilus sp.]|jgi:P27 family predicted phage terminase small subunit